MILESVPKSWSGNTFRKGSHRIPEVVVLLFVCFTLGVFRSLETKEEHVFLQLHMLSNIPWFPVHQALESGGQAQVAEAPDADVMSEGILVSRQTVQQPPCKSWTSWSPHCQSAVRSHWILCRCLQSSVACNVTVASKKSASIGASLSSERVEL